MCFRAGVMNLKSELSMGSQIVPRRVSPMSQWFFNTRNRHQRAGNPPETHDSRHRPDHEA
jgi:hypothetical protein